MTRQESLLAEIVFDLSYMAGEDKLCDYLEDSRELFIIIKEWAEGFEKKYPHPALPIKDFSELHNKDYFSAIYEFYIDRRNELVSEKFNITIVDITKRAIFKYN